MLTKNKNFKNLFFSQLFANSGDTLYLVGVISFIYFQTGQVSKSALVPVFITLGLFISGLFSDYLYARILKKRILLINQIIKTIIMIFIMFTYLNTSSFYILYALIFLNALFDGFTNPIKNSLLPAILNEGLLIKGNSVMNIMNSTIQVSMWAIGGIIVSFLGNFSSILLTFIFYLISLFFILKLKNLNDSLEKKKKLIQGFSDMLKEVFQIKQSIYFNISTFLEAFGHGVWVAAILIVYVEENLKQSSYWFGIINAIFFCGLIFGGSISSKFNKKLKKEEYNIIVYIPLALVICELVFGLNTSLLLAIISPFIYGFLYQIRDVILNSYIQQKLNESQLLKTYTISNMVYSLSYGASTIILSKVVEVMGIKYAFLLSSFFYFMCFVVSLLFNKNNLKKYRIIK